MKMWSLEVITLLLFCYACLSTDSQRVYFVSRNFNNVLHWDPVEPAMENVTNTYSVQYWRYEEPSEKKDGCQNTTALFCDLTANTTSIHDVHYMAMVFVNGREHGKTLMRFKPIVDTTLGPPILSTNANATSLHVEVTLPSGQNGVSIAESINSSRHRPSKALAIYILRITQPEWAAQERKISGNKTGQFDIKLKNNGTQYCGHVIYKPNIGFGHKESENASFCVTLPGDPTQPLLWLLLSAALLVALVTMLGVYMWNYVKIGKDTSMPKQLIPTSSTLPRVLQSPEGNLSISKVEVCPKSDQTVYATILVKPNAASVKAGGYSPQDIPFPAWQSSSDSSVGTDVCSGSANLEDTSAQSSEIYSVVAVHVPAEEKNFQQGTLQDSETSSPPLSSSREGWNGGGMSSKLSPHGVLPLNDLDSDPAMPLMLHTVRDSNGQLVLPSLNFQLQSSDTERKPLLSDLIDSKREGPLLASLHSFDGSDWSDSGCGSTLNTPTQPYCNTHYFPSQPVVSYLHQGCQNTQLSNNATSESGYKENWMPALQRVMFSGDSCEYRRTNYPWTWSGTKEEEEREEEEKRGGEEASQKIPLGNWMVQIQD